MARLPQPGGDAGNWGSILNDYLTQSHKADGTLKSDIVTSDTIASNTITSDQLAPNSVTNSALASGSVNASTIADGSITEDLLADTVQVKLNAPVNIADGSLTKSKLDTAVQASLSKADTALQAVSESRSNYKLLPLAPIATRPIWFERFITDAGRSSRIRHVAINTTIDLVLVYANYGSQDVEPDGPIKVRASIETAPGVWFKVHFANEDANRDVTIPPGGIVHSLPVSVPISAGAIFWSNTLVVPLGTQYPAGGAYCESNAGVTTERCIPASSVDYTTATNPGSVATQYLYGPVAICGVTVTRTPSIAVVGDSISMGTGDTQINNTNDNGYLVRAFNSQYPYMLLGLNGESASNWDAASQTNISRHRYRSSYLSSIDYVVQEHCTNDFGNNNRSCAQLQTSLIASWTQMKLRGVKIYQTTCTPRTTSTDSFVSITNQTAVNARFGPETTTSDRQQFNLWLRDGAPVLNGVAAAPGSSAAGTVRAGVSTGHLLNGVIDVAAVVEQFNSNTNTWVWKPNYTTDGIHPNATAHQAIAASILPTNLFL